MPDTVIIGVGNPYRHDDGVGPAIAAALRARQLHGATVSTSLGDTTELMDLWAGAPLAIVVDALRATPGHPGRVHRLTVPNDGGERARAASSHGIDLGEAVELARALGRLPDRLILYAVEVADVGHGEGLSPAVAATVERLADEIAGLIQAVRHRAEVA